MKLKLFTEIPLYPEENQIDYSSKTLLLGSCFSENIGAKFNFFKFQNSCNPFGVIFNPVSIEKLVVRAIDNNHFTEVDIFQHNGIWKCFDAHSELSSLDKDKFLENLNSALKNLREALFSSTHIILTLGTSWVYFNLGTSAPLNDSSSNLLSDQGIVANCHKLPQNNFQKKLLSVQEISDSLKNIFDKISEINSKAVIIITVSPVRHIKDGFAENSLSKAYLITAIHYLLSLQTLSVAMGSRKASYFPSYEIMMDELRDYRFYSEDMLHPNKTAIDIIWQKFSKVWISPETESLQKKVATIQSGLLHRPLNPKSEEHLQFLEKLQQKIYTLQQNFPHIKF